MQGVEATVFGMLMSLHIASFNTGKVFGSLLTTAFGVTSTDFTNLAPLVLVRPLYHSSTIQCFPAAEDVFYRRSAIL